MKSKQSHKILNDSSKQAGPPKLVQSLTLLQLLRTFNTDNKGFIELENMVSSIQKNLLKNIPEPQLSTIKNLFYAWIFANQNFKLPVQSFVSLYEAHMKSLAEKRNSNERLKVQKTVRSATPIAVSRVPSRNTENRNEGSLRRTTKLSEVSISMRKKLRDLSNERNFISYDNEIYDISLPNSAEKSSNTRTPTDTQVYTGTRSETKKSNIPGHRSYSAIHHKKNQIQKQLNRKDLEMAHKLEVCKFRARSKSANRQDINTLSSNSGARLSTYEDSQSENESFTFDNLSQFRHRFSNAEDLLQIRRRHLKQSLCLNKNAV